MTYEFYPGGLGYLGGYVRLILHVTNEGATNIDKVTAVINLKAGFSQTWTGTIAPGEEKKIVFDDIHFTEDDVNVQRFLQVAINNDGDTNPDGVQMVSFTMPGAGTLFRLTYDLSPSGSTLHPGDTLSGDIYIDNTNTADGMILDNLNVTVTIELDGADNQYLPTHDYGSLGPGESVVHTFSYVLQETDVTERLRVLCNVKCSLAGTNYGFNNYSVPYTVEEAPRATPSPSPSPSPTALPTPSATPAPAAVTATHTVSAAASALTPSPSPSAAVAAAGIQPPDTLTMALLIAIAALLLIVAALAVVLLLRRRKNKKAADEKQPG